MLRVSKKVASGNIVYIRKDGLVCNAQKNTKNIAGVFQVGRTQKILPLSGGQPVIVETPTGIVYHGGVNVKVGT